MASAALLRLSSVALSGEALRSALLRKGIWPALMASASAVAAEALRYALLSAPLYPLPTQGQRCIFITGAASGIGLATAKIFAAEGWFVGLFDIVDRTAWEEIVAQLGTPCCFGYCNVTDTRSVALALSEFALASGGRLDCLFNCAGLLRVGMLEQIDLAQQMEQVRVNLDGMVYCTREALPLLRKTPGSVIITMASVSSIYGIPTHAVYSATKRAVFALTEALSLELEPHKVRVCDVFVGYVNTPLLTKSDEHVPKETQALKSTSAWKDPDDVARTVWNAATAKSPTDLCRLHFPVDTAVWLVDQIVKVDALFGLGFSSWGLRKAIMQQSKL